jgi:hypothetical protein
MINIFELSFLGVMRNRDYSLDIIEDFYRKAEKIRKWIDRNPQKAKLILEGKVLKNKQQKYYYKGV